MTVKDLLLYSIDIDLSFNSVTPYRFRIKNIEYTFYVSKRSDKYSSRIWKNNKCIRTKSNLKF